MNKNLKYICIEGVLQSRGEYKNNSTEYRPYEAVSIVDKDGDKIHFHTLSISKRMDESIILNTPMKFYIFRYRYKDKLIGILYALEIDENKYFYPDTAIPALTSFAFQTRFRSQIVSDHMTFIGAWALGGAVLSTALCMGLGIDSNIAIPSGFAGTLIYINIPLFTKKKAAGISEMNKILQNAGFDINKNNNSKY